MKWFADSYPDRFKDAENYPADFSEEDQKKVLEALDAGGSKEEPDTYRVRATRENVRCPNPCPCVRGGAKLVVRAKVRLL